MIMINSFNDGTIEGMKNNFIETYNRAKMIFKDNAFRLNSNLPINMILFEMTLIIVDAAKNKSNQEIQEIYNKYLHWNKMDNEDRETTFEKNIKYHRDSKDNIEDRLKFVKNLIGE